MNRSPPGRDLWDMTDLGYTSSGGALQWLQPPHPSSLSETTVTRTLRRGLDVLEALARADEDGLGPSAIGQQVDLDKATVTRLLRTLVEAGYVTQDEATRRYRLTGKILWLAHGVDGPPRPSERRASAPHGAARRARRDRPPWRHGGPPDRLRRQGGSRQQHPARVAHRPDHAAPLHRAWKGHARRVAGGGTRADVCANGLLAADRQDDPRLRDVPRRRSSVRSSAATPPTTARTSRSARASGRRSSAPTAGRPARSASPDRIFRIRDRLP